MAVLACRMNRVWGSGITKGVLLSPHSQVGFLLLDEALNLARQKPASPSTFCLQSHISTHHPLSSTHLALWKPREGLPKGTFHTCFLISPSFFYPSNSLLCFLPHLLFFFLVMYLTGLTGYKLLVSDTEPDTSHWCLVIGAGGWPSWHLWGARWLGEFYFSLRLLRWTSDHIQTPIPNWGMRFYC